MEKSRPSVCHDDAAGQARKERGIRKIRTRYTLINMVVAALAAVSYGWVSFCPAKNIGWFLVDGVLYTLLFGAVMAVLHRNAPEFNQLKGRVTAVLKRRES